MYIYVATMESELDSIQYASDEELLKFCEPPDSVSSARSEEGNELYSADSEGDDIWMDDIQMFQTIKQMSDQFLDEDEQSQESKSASKNDSVEEFECQQRQNSPVYDEKGPYSLNEDHTNLNNKRKLPRSSGIRGRLSLTTVGTENAAGEIELLSQGDHGKITGQQGHLATDRDTDITVSTGLATVTSQHQATNSSSQEEEIRQFESSQESGDVVIMPGTTSRATLKTKLKGSDIPRTHESAATTGNDINTCEKNPSRTEANSTDVISLTQSSDDSEVNHNAPQNCHVEAPRTWHTSRHHTFNNTRGPHNRTAHSVRKRFRTQRIDFMLVSPGK